MSNSAMRWRCLLAALVSLCGTLPAWCTDFPYAAYVNSADVYVRSGPGRNYYPTDKLNKGEKVEVYRHDPGGWYAIRPPRHSFSWVSSRHLDSVQGDLAIVNSPRAVARVGSALSDVREVIQVRLDKGEKVELLEPQSNQNTWCKIAPPAGEFRWVFSKFVDHQLPDDLAQDEREAGGRGVTEPTIADRAASAVRLASGQGPDASVPGEAENPIAPRASAGDAEQATATATVLQRDLDRIEVDLSAMVAGEISGWSFAELKRRASAVRDAAQTPVERGRAHLLCEKLDRFEEIKQRHDALSPKQPQPTPGVALASLERRAEDPRYDGVGRLAPVISQKIGGPQYALVDSAGTVISFITPAPGVNLRPFVDKYVGVNGQRGYMADLQRQHIHVQRVTQLEIARR
jgi:hypothetical protein